MNKRAAALLQEKEAGVNKEHDAGVYLYFLVRTDLASMTRGRASAQVSHATSAFHDYMSSASKDDKVLETAWRSQAKNRIGTVICKDVGDEASLRYYMDLIKRCNVPCGTYTDESYSVRDGSVTLFTPVTTVGWALMHKEHPKASEHMMSLPLLPEDNAVERN